MEPPPSERSSWSLDYVSPDATIVSAVEIYRDPGDKATPVQETPTLPWVHAMWQQARNFVSVCRGEMAPPCDAAEAVEDLKIARDYIRLFLGK